MYRIIGKDGQQYGPVTADQLRGWITENRVNAQTITQAEGDLQWKPLGSFAEFAPDLKFPSTSPTVPPTIAAPTSSVNLRASNKLPAGIATLSPDVARLYRPRAGYAPGYSADLRARVASHAHHRPGGRYHLPLQVRRRVRPALRGRTQGVVLDRRVVISQRVSYA